MGLPYKEIICSNGWTPYRKEGIDRVISLETERWEPINMCMCTLWTGLNVHQVKKFVKCRTVCFLEKTLCAGKSFNKTWEQFFVNPFIPKFLQWCLPSLHLDTSIVANRISISSPFKIWNSDFELALDDEKQAIFREINPCPAEPGYILSLQTVKIQISWLLQKPTDLDLHCLPLSMWIYSNNLDQVIWLAEK